MKKSKNENKNTLNKILNIIIYSCLALFIIHLITYIFVGSKGLMNSDSSFITDYSLEQIKNHKVFPRLWVNTNDFWVYSLIPCITVFIKFGCSLFFSRQLTVLIQSVLLILVAYDLFKNQLGLKKSTKLILLLLLSGLSGQILFEIFGDATYGTIIFYMLLEVWICIKYLKNSKKTDLIFFSAILFLLTSCSLRFPIFIAAPLIVCMLYLFYENPQNRKPMYIIICTIVSTICGYVIYKYLCSHLTFVSTTENFIVSDISYFNEAIHNTLFNYLWLCGVTHINVFTLTRTYYNELIKTTSPLVAITFIRFIFSIVTITMPFLLFKKYKQMNDNEKILHIFSLTFSLLILFFLIFGGLWWWYRYITAPIFFLVLLYPLYYKYLFSGSEKNKVVFKVGVIVISLTSAFLSFTSWYDLKNKAIIKSPFEELTVFLNKHDLSYGYYNGYTEHNVFRLISNGKVQITRIDGIKPILWLNSKDWYTEGYHQGRTFVIRKTDQQPQPYEKEAVEKLKFNDEIIFVFKDHDDILKYLDTSELYK